MPLKLTAKQKTGLELLAYGQRGTEKVSESRFVTSVRKIINPAAATAPLGVNLMKKSRPAALRNPNAIQDVHQLTVGSVVNHRAFGRCEIVAVGPANLELRVGGTVKTLSIAVCLDNGLLEMP